IQIIKFPLRESLTYGSTDLSLVKGVIDESVSSSERKSAVQQIADVVYRTSEGWITSSVMEYHREGGFEFQNGSHAIIILKSAILPRILAPNKYKLGDGELFNKYSGHFINESTSMAL